MRMDINLQDLAYLVTLAEVGHFRKAADQCFVSQPTLSGQIKKLEQQLGVLLVDRSSRKVRMTAAGREVVARARSLLAQTMEIKEIARVYANPMKGVLHLGIIPTLAPYLLPLIVGPIQARYPELELMLVEAQTAVCVQKLEEGSLDVALLALPVEARGMQEKALLEEPFWLAVPAQHPWSERAAIRTASLTDHALMLLEEGHCLRDQALSFCRTSGAHERAGFRATSLETLRHMVAAGRGLTLIPALAVPQERTGLIRYIPFEGQAPSRSVGLLYRENSPLAECFQRLGQTVRDAFCSPAEGKCFHGCRVVA